MGLASILSSLLGGSQKGAYGPNPNPAQFTGGGEAGASSLLNILPGLLQSFKGINTGPQQQIAGQQQNIANAIYNPSNPLYQQLYGQQKQAIQQNTAATIGQASNQNRLLSSMGRTPLFSPERNGEESFRQAVMGQQGADVQAQNQTRSVLQAGEQALGSPGSLYQGGTGALGGANNLNTLQYGAGRLGEGAGNQELVGFNSLAQLLRDGGM